MISTLRKLSCIGMIDGLPEREVKGVISLNMLALTQVPVGLLHAAAAALAA